MSTVAENKIATGAKVVQARNVSKVFKREAFEVKALTTSRSILRPANSWR
jgi:hypothetical protein